MGCAHRRFNNKTGTFYAKEDLMGVLLGVNRQDPPVNAPVLRARAVEIRRIAGDFDDMQARAELYRLADHWDGLALRLESRTGQH